MSTEIKQQQQDVATQAKQPENTHITEINQALYAINREMIEISKKIEEQNNEALQELFASLTKLRDEMAQALIENSEDKTLLETYEIKSEETAEMVRAVLSDQAWDVKIEAIRNWENKCSEDVFWQQFGKAVAAVIITAVCAVLTATMGGIAGLLVGAQLGSFIGGPYGAMVGGITGFAVGVVVGLAVGAYFGDSIAHILFDGAVLPHFDPQVTHVEDRGWGISFFNYRKFPGFFKQPHWEKESSFYNTYCFWRQPPINDDIKQVGKSATHVAALPKLK